jgi:hypothetical protein
MRPCAFCPQDANNDEHVFDDWLNREDGRTIKRRYANIQTGRGGVVLRTYRSRAINVTRPVVCSDCNNGWMSDITHASRNILLGFIRYERPATLLPLGILTVAQLAFLKASVIDYADKSGFFSPRARTTFRLTLRPPDGTQVWMARFRSRLAMANHSHLDGMTFRSGVFKGFEIAVYTYVIGLFALQLTCPTWRKRSKRKGPTPFITQAAIWDRAAIPIWPHVHAATWPPAQYITDDLLDTFRERFRRMNAPV